MDNTTYSKALNKYLTTLKKTGYISKCDQNKLLIPLLLNVFLRNFAEYLTSKDRVKINRLIDCFMTNSCFTKDTADSETSRNKAQAFGFATSPQEDRQAYLQFTEGNSIAVASDGKLKGVTVTIDVKGTNQKIVMVSKDSQVSATYGWWDFPFRTEEASNGYYIHESLNNYSNQRVTIKFN